MIYQSSKGPVEVSTMPLSYAKNALNKLRRTEAGRTEEIEALDAHVTRLEAEATEEKLSPPVRDGAAPIGDNNPPADDQAPAPVITGRVAIEAHVVDLLADVQGLCLVIENQDQADIVSRLHRDLQKAVKLVDNSADEEKAPHNKAIAEIGTWQNGFTAAKLKKTPDGSLTKALLATTNLTSAWLVKQDNERRAREAAAAAAAAEKAREALAAREEAKVSTDTDVMDKADTTMDEARALMRQAENVAKEKPRSGGGDGMRAMSLRSYYSAESTGEDRCWNDALAHYLKNPDFKEELFALLTRWANSDFQTEAGRARGVPGFRVHEDRRAA